MNDSKRIKTIVSFIDSGAIIADVGSDHCRVPIRAINEGKIAYAQAIENKKGPYQRMVKEIRNNGLEASIEASLSDGIEELSPKADTLIVAGMGGKLIKSIIEAHADKLKNIETIIIDAHNDRPMLTLYLSSIGYKIEQNSFFFEDGIAYDVMKWKRANSVVSYSQEEVFFGPLNVKNKPIDWISYWKGEYDRMNGILKNNDLPDDVKNKYLNLINKIEIFVINNQQRTI